MPSSGLMLSNGGNGVSRMDCALSQSMDSVNTVAAEEEVRNYSYSFTFQHPLGRWKVSSYYHYCRERDNFRVVLFSRSNLRSSEQRATTRPPTFLSSFLSVPLGSFPSTQTASQPDDSSSSSLLFRDISNDDEDEERTRRTPFL